MKLFNVILVREDQTATLEQVLSAYRIGLNDWGKTRTLYFQGIGYVSYTILCTAGIFETIKGIMDRV